MKIIYRDSKRLYTQEDLEKLLLNKTIKLKKCSGKIITIEENMNFNYFDIIIKNIKVFPMDPVQIRWNQSVVP